MYKKIGLIVGMLVIPSVVVANTDVSLPAAWKVASNENYSNGYVKVFVPQAAHGRLNEQNVVINYAKRIKSSLNASMQEVANVVAKADCTTRDVKVINEDKNSINFVALLNNCKNGKSLAQAFKVFNAPDGQYTIMYTANPKVVSAAKINDMQQWINKLGRLG